MDPLISSRVGSTTARRLRVSLVVVHLSIACAKHAWAQSELHELTQPVNDFARVIAASDAVVMNRMSRSLQQATGDVIVVATVNTIQPYGEIREYAVKLFENHGRGIGQKGQDNGLLVLLAVRERQVWIEVGYGLEEFVTDGFSGETSRQYMAPAFREGDYGRGLRAGVTRLAGRIAQARGVTLTDIPPVSLTTPRLTPGGLPIWVILLLIILFVVLSSRGGPTIIGRRRRWGGGPWSGWSSGVGSFGGGSGGGGFGGGFGGFGGGRSGGGGGGAGW